MRSRHSNGHKTKICGNIGQIEKIYTKKVCIKYLYNLTYTADTNSSAKKKKKSIAYRRGCFYSFERKLTFFKQYQERNCWMECLTNFTRSLCGCVFYYMPRVQETLLCGMAKASCFLVAKENVKIELETLTTDVTDFAYDNVCNCLPTCNSISYEADVSQSTLASGHKMANNLVLS